MNITQDSVRRFYSLIHLSTRDIQEEWKYLYGINGGTHKCKPTNVNIDIINNCCLRCQMCNVWQNKGKVELTIPDWIRIIDQLKEWLGSFRLTISGGEPFMKPGIWDFLAHCGKIGIPTVVLTNGYLFTKQHLHLLLDLNITQLVFSLDSLDSKKHDQIRGVPGAFNHLWKNMTYLADKSHRFLLATNTVIMSKNIDEIHRFPSALEQIGIERMLFQPIQGGFGQDCQSLFQSELWPRNAEAINKAIQALIVEKRNGAPIANTFEELSEFTDYLTQAAKWERPFKCSSGRKMFQCDSLGNVRMCTPFAGNIGNLMFDSPQAIWDGVRAQEEREKILSCKTACLLNCNRDYFMGEKILYAVKYLQKTFK